MGGVRAKPTAAELDIDFIDAVRVGSRSYALWRAFHAPLLVVEDLQSGRCHRISLPFPFRIERYSAAVMGERFVALEIGIREVIGFAVLDLRSMAPALVVESAPGRVLPGVGPSVWQLCPGAGLFRVSLQRHRLRRERVLEESTLHAADGDGRVRRGCAGPTGATLLRSDGAVVHVRAEHGRPEIVGSVGRPLADLRCVARVADRLVFVTVDAPQMIEVHDLRDDTTRHVVVPFEVGMLRPLGIGGQVAIWSLGASHAEVWDAESDTWVRTGVGVPVGV